MYYDWKPYVSVEERRRQAELEMNKLRKKGQIVSPVMIEGRTIAKTFWGKAWCENLERYSDYSNRLPRGRTYVRNGSVIDLQIGSGEVKAMVSGSSIYRVTVSVSQVPPERWKAVCKDCSGAIDSLVELLAGRFSKGVMERICRARTGLFPSPAEIKLKCSCPDWATMCKHVAAVLYGIGARLDERPELLFKLRQVDESDLLASAGKGLTLPTAGISAKKVLGGSDLSELFGLELAVELTVPAVAKSTGRSAKKPAPVARSAEVSGAEAPATKVARKAGKVAASRGSGKAAPTAKPALTVKAARTAEAAETGSVAQSTKPLIARASATVPTGDRRSAVGPGMTFVTALAGPQGKVWSRVGSLIGQEHPQAYDEAVGLLETLVAEGLEDHRGPEIQAVIDALRELHAQKPEFLKRLDHLSHMTA